MVRGNPACGPVLGWVHTPHPCWCPQPSPLSGEPCPLSGSSVSPAQAREGSHTGGRAELTSPGRSPAEAGLSPWSPCCGVTRPPQPGAGPCVLSPPPVRPPPALPFCGCTSCCLGDSPPLTVPHASVSRLGVHCSPLGERVPSSLEPRGAERHHPVSKSFRLGGSRHQEAGSCLTHPLCCDSNATLPKVSFRSSGSVSATT